MKLARLLFKPKWQHKDVAVRRAAVAESADAELVAALPEIARSDSASAVRATALRRLNDYECWRERSTGDPDDELRRIARASYLAMLVGTTGVPPIERRIAELDTLSAEEIERIAAAATDTALRRAALERVSRPSLLADRAVGDSDAALRQYALSRIDDVDALNRVAERARKTDKTVSRIARERADSLRIASGDTRAIEERARRLCERIESLLQVARSDRDAELADLDQAWAEISGRVPPALRERFESTRVFLRSDTSEAADQRERLRDLRGRLERLLPELAIADAGTIEPLVAESTATLAATMPELPDHARIEEIVVRLARRLAGIAAGTTDAGTPAPASGPIVALRSNHADAVAAHARFDAAIASAEAHTQRQLERRKHLQQELDRVVIELEHRLEAGDVAGAHVQHAETQRLLADLPPIARHDRRLVNAIGRYAEIKRWQRWSNNERRKQLCDAIEAFTATGAHPDAVSNRVRELRAEWQLLDASEGILDSEADAARGGLARRFNALCGQALKPAKGYFAKRDELRHAQHEQIDTLLRALDEAMLPSIDIGSLVVRRREVAASLRQLDAVEPRTRKTLAARIKETLGRIDARLDAQAADVEAAKRRLIDRAEQLAGGKDDAAAAREIRDLQAQWKAAGNGRRKTDEAQWKQFRGHCDIVFGRLDGDRREREQQDTQRRHAAVALVDSMTALLTQPADATRAERRDLQKRWSEIELRDRELDRRWQELRDRSDQLERDDERRRRTQDLHDAVSRIGVCVDLERAVIDVPTAQQRWERSADIGGELGVALDARYAAATAGTPIRLPGDDLPRGRDLLVQLEYLGARETPEEDRKRRMDFQVGRLSRRMKTGTQRNARDELIDVLVQWVSLGSLDDGVGASLRERFDRACAAAIAQLP